MSLEYIISTMIKRTPMPVSTPISGQVISEDFNGSALSTKWSIPPNQTIAVTGGKINVVGSGTTKDATKVLRNVGYWQSTLRNYAVELVSFKINTIGANTKGVYVGVDSGNNGDVGDFVFSAVALLDYSSTPVLQIICPDVHGVFKTPAQASVTAGMPSINTSDRYTLRFEMNDQRATATLTNLDTPGSVSVHYDYISLTPTSPNRPNIFYYCFGVCASTDITAERFTVSTTEIINPKYVFIGDSITTGYCATLFTDGYASVLKTHTNDSLQIMAGGGNNLHSVENNMTEIARVIPDIVFLNIGTNPYGDFTNYKKVVTSMQNEGIIVYPLLIVTGGNPVTGGTYNNDIATTYPSLYIDIWTAGWNTMSIGNGEMVDSLHPTTIGHLKLANIIRAAKPLLFPL